MRFDLIIVGGGLVGTSLLLALRQTHLHVALIDAKLPSPNDPRLFALNSSSCQFLENLGVWPELVSHATPIHEVHVSNQGKFGAVRLNREDVNLFTLGHVIPANHIELFLNRAVESLTQFSVYRPAKLTSLSQQTDGVALTIESEAGEITLEANMVIAADGTESTVRGHLNVDTEIFDYQQSALVTKTTLKRSHQHIAYERFNHKGAIAMLPLQNNECATIWSADTETIVNLMALSDTEFLQALQTAFGDRLGSLQATHKRHLFPLRMLKTNTTVDRRVFLLGNSAHTLHPIAAQGLNLALYEIAVLAEEMKQKQAAILPADLNHIMMKIKKQQATSIGVSHRLAQLFSSESFLMGTILQLGMIGLDIAIPLKRKFIETILGRTGRVPRLLLSENEL